MGSILSFFKKEKTIEKVLEQIDQQIHDAEIRQMGYKTSWRTITSYLMAWSFLFELLYFVWWYFWFQQQRHDALETSKYFSPLLLIPIVAWVVSRILNFYYSRRISQDVLWLRELKAKQKSKLEEFAKATDFYKTQAIINRYQKTLETVDTDKTEKPTRDTKQTDPSIGLHHRPPPSKQMVSPPPQFRPQIPEVINSQPLPTTPHTVPTYTMPVPADRRFIVSQNPRLPNAPTTVAQVPPGERAWYDKLVDFVIGEGPEHNMAMICEKCLAHNGLAPKEEMEQIQFRCRNCNHFNQKGLLETKQEVSKEGQNVTETEHQENSTNEHQPKGKETVELDKEEKKQS